MKRLITIIKIILPIVICCCLLHFAYLYNDTSSNGSYTVNEQLTYVAVSDAPHYKFKQEINLNDKYVILINLEKKGDKIYINSQSNSLDERYFIFYKTYTCFLGKNNKPYIQFKYDYIDNQPFILLNNDVVYNQLILQNNNDPNEIIVVDME